MKTNKDPKTIFFDYFPSQAVDYCFYLWKTYNFEFKITKKRQSKLGDYRYTFATKSHTITVNADLNPYSFLVTYIHEVAHLTTQLKHGNNHEPHGIEWKNEYKTLAKPILNSEVFPTHILQVFTKYLINPKASSCADHDLIHALDIHNEPDNKIMLINLSIGNKFLLKEKKFIKNEVNRTRTLCTEVSTGKKYLISNIARVLAEV